jgi:hypothetical protein
LIVCLWQFFKANETAEHFKVGFREINLIPVNCVNPILQLGILTIVPKSESSVVNVVGEIPEVFVTWNV